MWLPLEIIWHCRGRNRYWNRTARKTECFRGGEQFENTANSRDVSIAKWPFYEAALRAYEHESFNLSEKRTCTIQINTCTMTSQSCFSFRISMSCYWSKIPAFCRVVAAIVALNCVRWWSIESWLELFLTFSIDHNTWNIYRFVNV